MSEITSKDRFKANRRLATALGWTNIQPYGDGGRAVGLPPAQQGGLLIIPMWTDEGHACLELLATYRINLTFSDEAVTATGAPGPMRFDRHPSQSAAIRYAIVVAAISILEGKKNGG